MPKPEESRQLHSPFTFSARLPWQGHFAFATASGR